MKKTQKTYTAEFKREAVHLAQTSDKPITQIARELGISDTSIHQWYKELAEHGPEAFPGSGHQTALEEENRRNIADRCALLPWTCPDLFHNLGFQIPQDFTDTWTIWTEDTDIQLKRHACLLLSVFALRSITKPLQRNRRGRNSWP